MLEPKVLLWDEPTFALDMGHSKNLAEILMEYQTKTIIPMVVATHELDFAKYLATRIIYLEKSQVVMNTPSIDIDWTDLKQQSLDVEKNAPIGDW